MKPVLSLLFFPVVTPGAVPFKYEHEMTQTVRLWHTIKLDEASNLFEPMAIAENEEWLPDFYVAQLQILKCCSSWENREEIVIKSNLDEAQEKQCKEIPRAIEVLHTFKPETKFYPSFSIDRAKEVATRSI